MLRDRATLTRRLESVARQLRLGRDISVRFAELERDVRHGLERREARAAATPALSFPEELPIVERKGEIAEAIRAHQVVVVSGETGSGKSTQLPKICLGLGRGVDGIIGHTQPRRIAARTLAHRLASELSTQVGSAVGYKVRFGDHTGPGTYVKLMTDGILLAEIEHDRNVLQYDTIIVDEAHERSLNIDFILGYLKRLLPARPDLKVIVTSATIDAARFAEHFSGAPVIEVSGRTFPVEVRHRAATATDRDEDEQDLTLEERISLAVAELSREGRGDILVFLPTERAIHETAERLRKDELVGTDILPLFARLSAAEQNRIFDPRGGRRIVLATNVAETSLTVPGIRYVIDTGLARVRHYDSHRGVERLPVERISQASARQRMGRCGRTSAGICIRLYSEEDFLSRTPFTMPEIGRSNLAGVILRMESLGLGTLEDFPFVDAPDRRAAKDAYEALIALGAIDEEHRLTSIGKKLARLPVDPRIGRMLLAGHEQKCLPAVLIIAAALSTQDPRERPQEKREQADQAHRQYHGKGSDFAGLLLLFRAYQKEGATLTKSKLRAFCQKNFLSFTRMREWADVHDQLEEQARELGLSHADAPGQDDDASVHRAVLAGLLRNVAMKFDDRMYVGARNVKLAIHPSSALNKKRPQWIVAAEMVETDRLYARTVAQIDPEWIELLAAHVVARSYAEPRWDPERGQVIADEKVTLYGLPVARHRVDFSRIDVEAAREIFIREALVKGEIRTHGAFRKHNDDVLKSFEALAERARRHDVASDGQAVYAFFDAKLPPDVCSTISFERWRKLAERDDPMILFLDRDRIAGEGAATMTEESFPSTIVLGDHAVELRYRFAPGDEDDGITAVVPLAILHLLAPAEPEWLVAGMHADKARALVESLPKALRRTLPPIDDWTKELAGVPRSTPLTEAMATALVRAGSAVSPSDFRPELIGEHLRMRFEVIGDQGKVAATSRDLPALQRGLAERAREAFARLPRAIERDSVTAWDFGDLPEKVDIRQGRVNVVGFPALAVEDGHVALRVFDSGMRAAAEHRDGVASLVAVMLGEVAKSVRRSVSSASCLQYAALESADALRNDILRAAILAACVDGREPVRTAAAFAARTRETRGQIAGVAAEIGQHVAEALEAYHRVLAKGERAKSGPIMRAHLGRLIYRGFVVATPLEALTKLPRYLKALEIRIERREHNAPKYREKESQIEALFAAYEKARAERPYDALLEHYRWLLEEFHVFLFAQELVASEVVTEKRLAEAWRAVG
jgi:ATP-dependent helicase HrpA